VFTKERLNDIPEAKCEYKDPQRLGISCDIEINEGIIIIDKLQKLRDDKASGADELVPRF